MELNDFQFFTDSSTLPKRVNIKQCQCLDCFALFMNPVYSTYGLKILFDEAASSYGAAEGRSKEQRQWLLNRRLLNSGVIVMDVGCYDGYFLSQLPEGVQKIGIDINLQAIKRAQKKHVLRNIKFICDNFETFKTDTKPDIITMFHVLEHLSHPILVLRRLREIANRRTKILIETPILEKGTTNDINGFFSVQHVTHFSQRSLENIMLKAGWRIIERYEQKDYNGYRILAEPSNTVDVIKNNPDDVNLLYKYLSAWWDTLYNKNKKINLYHDISHCFIWGAGLHTELLYHMTSFFQINRNRKYALIDSDSSKYGKTWRGIKIYSPSILNGVKWSKLYSLLISSYSGQKDIMQNAFRLNVPKDNVIAIYEKVKSY